jgi:hypothetical protein
MRRLLPAALIFLTLGPVPGTGFDYPVVDSSQSATARTLRHPAATGGTLRFVRGWRLSSRNSLFGGFSALAYRGDGRFLLVGDNGEAVRLTLGADGSVSDVTIRALPTPPRSPKRKAFTDAEAVVRDPATGKLWIALEGINQIWRIDAAMTRVESRRRSPALYSWPANRGPEAMVRLTDGRTILFSEGEDRNDYGTEGLVYTDDPAVPGKKPVIFYYDDQGKGAVSDAAPLPDGRILLVHRKLGFDPLFTTELAIVDPVDIGKGRVVRSVSIGRVPERLHENYEGAAVTIEDGRTILWLVSDDNFNSWQRSLLLKFELVCLPDSKKAAR